MKNKTDKPLAKVFHFSLQGKRDDKYEFLNENSITTVPWTELDYKEPNFFFVPKDFSDEFSYIKGFKLDAVFNNYVSGFQTKRDKTTIRLSKSELQNIKSIFENSDEEDIRKILSLPEDGRDWTIEWAKKDLKENNPIITKVMYRPFDERFTFYTGKSKGFVAYPRSELFSHLNRNENISLITCRQLSTFDFQHLFTSRLVSDMCNISSQTKETGYIFPLYLYHEMNAQHTFDQSTERTPNLNLEIVNKIAEKLNYVFVEDDNITCEVGEGYSGAIYPLNILDYIYAVLHSPTYREKYKEFLKIDFPRVPYPKDRETFIQLCELGSELRQIHLLESPTVEKFITKYPVDGNNVVDKPRFEIYPYVPSLPDENGNIEYPDYLGAVYINDSQCFADVPISTWEFYIGGYQPAQKWLKDRKGRTLEFEDILHYQKIIVALSETDRIMKEIDKIEIE